jgi:hypothetical protein
MECGDLSPLLHRFDLIQPVVPEYRIKPNRQDQITRGALLGAESRSIGNVYWNLHDDDRAFARRAFD